MFPLCRRCCIFGEMNYVFLRRSAPFRRSQIEAWLWFRGVSTSSFIFFSMAGKGLRRQALANVENPSCPPSVTARQRSLRLCGRRPNYAAGPAIYHFGTTARHRLAAATLSLWLNTRSQPWSQKGRRGQCVQVFKDLSSNNQVQLELYNKNTCTTERYCKYNTLQ